MTMIAIALGLIFLALMFAPTAGRRLNRAIRSGSGEQIVDALEQINQGGRLNAYNTTIKQLWEGYRREIALVVIRSLAERYSDDKISQYWLDKALSVEPVLAEESLGESFIGQFYRPEVAQQCGSFG